MSRIFCSFWEGFESSVHQNTVLSVIDKFNYLRALLEGAAACSIQRLALTEGNYCAAIDISKEQSILRTLAKIFDPLDLLSPFVVGIKILFQTLCKGRVDWDVTLDRDMLSQWSNLIQEFERLSKISVPRCYVLLDQKIASQQLHGFCDASRRAYAAVIYLRTEYQNGHVSICVVCSKTRVAPLKE